MGEEFVPFTLREITQFLTHHYKVLSGDGRHAPAAIAAAETMAAMCQFIQQQRAAIAAAPKLAGEEGRR